MVQLRPSRGEQTNLLFTAIDVATGGNKLVSLPLSLQQGTVLCEPGGNLDRVFFPLTCVLSSMSTLRDGTAIETAVAGREGAFGLLTVLGSGQNSARCQVQIGGLAMVVRAQHFRNLFHRSEAVRRVVMPYIETVMFQNVQSVGCRTSHSMTARLCRWLLTMHDRVGGTSLSFTHEFVAPALGANRTTLSLAMGELRRNGLVAYTRSNVAILNRCGLEQKTCECYFNLRQRYERLFESGEELRHSSHRRRDVPSSSGLLA
jgi:CRP-like cAMP-binding protein